MITEECFQLVHEEYGHFASWAVWREQGDTAKSNIGDLSVFDRAKNPALLESLSVEHVLLALNISRPIERKLGNFHDPSPQATDYKIRHALAGTKFWGAYMTDIIKDFEEKASGKMMSYLKQNPQFERENIDFFVRELESIGAMDPHIVAFGRDAFDLAERTLGGRYQISAVPHYAHFMSPAEYRIKVHELLS